MSPNSSLTDKSKSPAERPFSYFTPNSTLKQLEEQNEINLTDSDFEEAVKHAVETIKQLSMDTGDGSQPDLKVNSLGSASDLQAREKNCNFDAASSVGFSGGDLDLFSNPNEKFNIGSRKSYHYGHGHNLGKKYAAAGKMSPKSAKLNSMNSGFSNFSRKNNSLKNLKNLSSLNNLNHLGSLGNLGNLNGSATFSTFGTATTSQEAANQTGNGGQDAVGHTKDANLFTKMKHLDKKSSATNNQAVKNHIQNMRNGFEKLKEMLKSDSPQLQLEATKGFRQMVSTKREALSQDLINKEIIPL